MCFNFSLTPLKIQRIRENGPKLSKFAKLQFLEDKIGQNGNFAKLPSTGKSLSKALILGSTNPSLLKKYQPIRES